ncbi:hypothetical protein B0H65DRAFT_538846 [Neurospora tetraspora]|uniref:Uncharacterized protein n=1 Tax=Neurospora tetraspora TaxID=94610 RepID=A0AAE0JJA5_9PEZI|nr:hypothetical protein B0H65DRAFT_538846 [Neurospora tetraspora]
MSEVKREKHRQKRKDVLIEEEANPCIVTEHVETPCSRLFYHKVSWISSDLITYIADVPRHREESVSEGQDIKSSASLSFAVLTTFGLLNLVTAVPTTPLNSPVHERDTPTTRFSFAKWVDDIIVNPKTALTSEQAWQAYLDSTLNGTSVASTTATEDHGLGEVDKRWDAAVTCNGTPVPPARTEYAVACINYLAKLGPRACSADPLSSFCKADQWAEITGTTCNPGTSNCESWSSCQEVARTAGLIMDTCTYSVGSELYIQGQRMNYAFDKNPKANMMVWVRTVTQFVEPHCGYVGP